MNVDPESYAMARALFHKALPLRGESRRLLIDQESRGREDIRREVESLLRHHEGSEPIPPLVSIAFETTAFDSFSSTVRRALHNRLLRFTLLLAVMLLLIFGAKLGRDRLHAALQKDISAHLESVLMGHCMAMEFWAGHRFKESTRWAEILSDEPALQDLIRISKTSRTPKEDLQDAQAQKRLQRLLEPALRSGPFLHYIIIDDSYRNISSDTLDSLGRKVDASTEVMVAIDQQLNGQTVFTPRWKMGTAFRDPEVVSRNEYVSWFGSPIRDATGQAIAVLGLAVEATQSFDMIFKAGHWGQSGETYAFNMKGQMLSDSRFSKQLVQLGILEPGEPTGLNLEIRDPGGDMTQGFRPQNPAEELPFTRIVSQAMGSLRLKPPLVRGQILEPYRDYRGVKVIGAWQWHPHLNLGVITEIDADEALLTMRFIDNLYLALISLFIGVSAMGCLATFKLLRMRPAALLGSRMGQYRLLRKINEGGLGEIYLARHEFLKRPTAIKILKCDVDDPESPRRFEAEVRATSQLTHPNTVAIYDFGRLMNGCFYYAMEYLPGISIARLIELETRLPPHRTIHLLLQVCGSLEEAHGMGLIHRDIKPLNIMVCRIGGQYDVVKVVDFGLVRSVKSLIPSESTAALPQKLRGTPAYMAPELLGDPAIANPGLDIYALGVVAYKMLSGRNLFRASHEGALLYDIVHTQPKDLGELRPDIPPRLSALVMQCLDKEPRARPADVTVLARALEASLEGPPWTQEEARCWWSVRDHLLLPPDA